jgi:CheY-like chemotaxis protein
MKHDLFGKPLHTFPDHALSRANRFRRFQEAAMPRVLIVDDEEPMRLLVARAVAMDGHDIITAADGVEALDILSGKDGSFDLLLTDIQMPVMDGIALALTAARDFPELTILLMTGFADQRERASGLNAIAYDVISKPFSVADIRTAVADALASRKVN